MLKKFFLVIIKFYQSFVSPFLGQNCRFYPSCSEYAYQAIRKDGAVKGCWKALRRIIKCNQWYGLFN